MIIVANLVAHEVAHVVEVGLITIRDGFGEMMPASFLSTLESIETLAGALACDAVWRTGRDPVFRDLHGSYNEHDVIAFRRMLAERTATVEEKAQAVARGMLRGRDVARFFITGGPVVDRYTAAAETGSFLVSAENWRDGPGMAMTREAWAALNRMPSITWEQLHGLEDAT